MEKKAKYTKKRYYLLFGTNIFDDLFYGKCIFLRGYCDKRKHLFWCKQFVFYNRCTHRRGKLKIVWLSGKVLMYVWWLNFVNAAWKRKKRVTILTIYIVSLLFYNIFHHNVFKSYSALLAWKNNSGVFKMKTVIKFPRCYHI